MQNGAVIYVYVYTYNIRTDIPKIPVLGPTLVFRYDVFSNTHISKSPIIYRNFSVYRN